MKNLWLLTEERPKSEVVRQILDRFMRDHSITGFFDPIRFIPVLDDGGSFKFIYEVLGLRSEKIHKIFIKTVSGESSFVDYLLFYQDNEPRNEDTPLYVIEETKTTDKESRNTGIGQRAAKFVYGRHFYPDAKFIMLYNLKTGEQQRPTQTNIFGTRCLMTLGVSIMGKKDQGNVAFGSIEELISFNADMKNPPAGNVPIKITRLDDHTIQVSGRLYKSGGLSHDPNIGTLSLIAASLRKLGWKGRIIITRHGLEQKHVSAKNKFIRIADMVGIELDGLDIVETKFPTSYWHYETKGEKLGTIFMHLAVESFTSGHSIFENHAGCEKSYFQTRSGEHVVLAKYKNQARYKAGDKSQIISIPDLILLDSENRTIINVEGKKAQNLQQGIQELEKFGAIEERYISKHYPDCKIVRTIILFGGDDKVLTELKVGFMLNHQGDLVLGAEAPKLFNQAIKNLRDYWRETFATACSVLKFLDLADTPFNYHQKHLPKTPILTAQNTLQKP